MKVLVFQVFIGAGSNHGEAFTRLFEQVMLPSVQRWAEASGYDYQCMTTPIGEPFAKHFLNTQAWYNSQRFFHFQANTEYDYVVYLDADIYISEQARQHRLPLQPGLTIRECRTHGRNILQGGFICADKATGKSFGDYIIDDIAQNNRVRLNQPYILKYARQVKPKLNLLDKKFNRRVSKVKENTDLSLLDTSQFLHFVGGKQNAETIINWFKRNGLF